MELVIRTNCVTFLGKIRNLKMERPRPMRPPGSATYVHGVLCQTITKSSQIHCQITSQVMFAL